MGHKREQLTHWYHLYALTTNRCSAWKHRQVEKGNIMKQSFLHLLTAGALVINVGSAVAVDIGDENINSSNTVHQKKQSEFKQNQQQIIDLLQKQRDVGSAQRVLRKPLDNDNDRLRDLEEELADEQLKNSVRENDRIHE